MSSVLIGTQYSQWTNLVKSINVLTGMKPNRADAKPPGRPREFDLDVAVERAMEVFWRKGYEAASMPELTRAMRINRPSLYAAFGNKEQLFRRVLDRYGSDTATFIPSALHEPTAAQVIQQIFRGAVEFLSARGHPRGCLLMQGTPACGDPADSVRREIAARRRAGEAAIRNRLERAKTHGELAPHANPADLAKFISALVHGMSIQAANGATRAQLQRLAEMATRACNQFISTSTPDHDATRSPIRTSAS
jgi:AcrR family transcriptional regulator